MAGNDDGKNESRELLTRAGDAAAAGKFGAAEAILREAARQAPNDAVVLNTLGGVLLRLNKTEAALAHFRRAIAAEPGAAAGHRNLGRALMRLNRAEDAAGCFARARDLRPGDGAILYELALALFAGRDLTRAAETARAALAEKPDLAEAHFLLGVIAEEASDLDGALAHYRHAVALKPDLTAARNNLGIARRYKRKDAEGLRALHETALAKPGDIAAYLDWATELWEQRRDGEASKALASAQARWPGSAAVRYLDALNKVSLGRRDDALAAFAQARALEPENGLIAYAEEGMNLAAKRRPKAAKRVAMHLNHQYHTAILGPVFDALKGRHRVLMTMYLRNLIDFDPDVVVTAETHCAFLRHYLPRAVYVGVRHGLVSKRTTYNGARLSDYFCITSEANRQWYLEQKAAPRKDFWITGYVQMDPLFRNDPMPIPFDVPQDYKTVLYAPTWNPELTSAAMLGGRLVELVRGRREGVALIIKPHPMMYKMQPDWIAAWRKMAENDAHVYLVEAPDADVMPYLAAADVLVSDVSSTVFQFLPRDRPIVLITNPLARQSPVYDPQGVEWTHRDAGEQIRDIAGLPYAIERALDDPAWGADGRARARDYLFGDLTDGQAAARIAKHIEDLP
ncbi:MAG: tetratricopeptide repeat protein [Rhodospirillales bacterium]